MDFEKIASMIADIADTDASEIKPETKFADLGIDSLDITELIMKLEDEYGITIEADSTIQTVGDFMAKLDAQKK